MCTATRASKKIKEIKKIRLTKLLVDKLKD
jgi:hypothetical protein